MLWCPVSLNLKWRSQKVNCFKTLAHSIIWKLKLIMLIVFILLQNFDKFWRLGGLKIKYKRIYSQLVWLVKKATNKTHTHRNLLSKSKSQSQIYFIIIKLSNVLNIVKVMYACKHFPNTIHTMIHYEIVAAMVQYAIKI